LKVEVRQKFDGSAVADKKNTAAVSTTDALTFVGMKLPNVLKIEFGELEVVSANVSGANVTAENFVKAGNSYTFDLKSAEAAAVGQRDLTLNVKVAGADKTAQLKGALTIARIFVSTLKFKGTNETMFEDQSEDAKNESFWVAGNNVSTHVFPDQKKLLPVAFIGHPPAGGAMPKPTAEVTIATEPTIVYDKQITINGTWAISDPAVKFTGTFKVSGAESKQTVVAEAALPETNPSKKDVPVSWTAKIGDEVSPMADSKTGPCYFLWAKPVWTGSQTDTDGRNIRIAGNQLTAHRLDKILSKISGKTTEKDIIAALHAFVNDVENENGVTARSNEWRVLSSKYLMQCGERSDFMERTLVMIGINALHVHAFIPHVAWAANDPRLGPARVLAYPCGATDYGIMYHDNIGDNFGEGCCVVPDPTVANPEVKVPLRTNGNVKRKFIFGTWYPMFSDLTAADAAAYDAAKEIIGAYKILFRLADEDQLFISGPNGRVKYAGWKNIVGGFPDP
jgi:hypothetical protein